MTIHREGNYLFDTDLNGILSIGIETGKIDLCVREAKRRDVKGVFGSSYCNFYEDNLDFFQHLPNLKKIWFWDVNLRSVEGVYALTDLKDFGVIEKRPCIDFSRLKTLEAMVWKFYPKDTGIGSLTQLKLLDLWHYNPKYRSYEGLEIPTSLEEFKIYWANPVNLAGLPFFPKLKTLEIHNCRNLQTLEGLPAIAPNIEFLVVDGCKNVSVGAEVVKLLPRLKHAYVQGTTLVEYKPEDD